jgi:hypothetical protein
MKGLTTERTCTIFFDRNVWCSALFAVVVWHSLVTLLALFADLLHGWTASRKAVVHSRFQGKKSFLFCLLTVSKVRIQISCLSPTHLPS